MRALEGIPLWGFMLQLVVAVVAVVWAVALLKESLRKDNEKGFEKLMHRIELLTKNTLAGEAKLIAKITEVEIWARDTFVRRESFFTATKDLKEDMTRQFEKLEEQLKERKGQ